VKKISPVRIQSQRPLVNYDLPLMLDPSAPAGDVTLRHFQMFVVHAGQYITRVLSPEC